MEFKAAAAFSMFWVLILSYSIASIWPQQLVFNVA